MNTTTIEGNLTRDVDLTYTDSGKAIAKFGVACNRNYDNAAGETTTITSFFNVVAWGEQGENVARSLSKGDRVIVVGEMQVRMYLDDNRTERTYVEINARAVAASMRWAEVNITRTDRAATVAA